MRTVGVVRLGPATPEDKREGFKQLLSGALRGEMPPTDTGLYGSTIEALAALARAVHEGAIGRVIDRLTAEARSAFRLEMSDDERAGVGVSTEARDALQALHFVAEAMARCNYDQGYFSPFNRTNSDLETAVHDALIARSGPYPDYILNEIRDFAADWYSGAALQGVLDKIDRFAKQSTAGQAAAIALIDLADQVAAAADLDDVARRGVDFSLEVGDPTLAICDALIDTRTPLPADLLKRIRAGVEIGWYDGATLDEVLAALDRQERKDQV